MGLFGPSDGTEKAPNIQSDLYGTGEPQSMASGWQAIIKNGAGQPDFRQFVIIYFSMKWGMSAFYRPLDRKRRF